MMFLQPERVRLRPECVLLFPKTAGERQKSASSIVLQPFPARAARDFAQTRAGGRLIDT